MANLDLQKIIEELKNYDGEEVRLMEVCGTHTAAISENGIPSMLSPKIKLISGPGCPVCVTVTAVIDRLVELSMVPGTCVLTFGDLIRVRGTAKSLAGVVEEQMGLEPDVASIRVAELAGTHTVGFEGTCDRITLEHEAFSRKGFAEGAVVAALMTEGLTGVHEFKELFFQEEKE